MLHPAPHPYIQTHPLRILKDLGVPIKDLILLYYDNMIVGIHLACNPVFQAQTKHIDVHFHILVPF